MFNWIQRHSLNSILLSLSQCDASWRFEFDEYAILQQNSLPNLESFYSGWKEKFGVCKFTKYGNTSCAWKRMRRYVRFKYFSLKYFCSVQFRINFQFQLSDWCRLRWRTIKFQSNTIHYTSNSFNSTTHNFRLIAYLWNFLYLTVSNRLLTLPETLFHCFRNLLWHIQKKLYLAHACKIKIERWKFFFWL